MRPAVSEANPCCLLRFRSCWVPSLCLSDGAGVQTEVSVIYGCCVMHQCLLGDGYKSSISLSGFHPCLGCVFWLLCVTNSTWSLRLEPDLAWRVTWHLVSWMNIWSIFLIPQEGLWVTFHVYLFTYLFVCNSIWRSENSLQVADSLLSLCGL